ncbi:hypothetical protein OIU77_017007 [Salix suchowensis]|uniref:Uncharacterized protein n=1 Tax=Salix suchowensis TaxID=1278906 RepID=A0ABQ8ZMU0_9ROSI|nr:hypothetical protein OIU77_017007 [Salix suchowensis]
MAAKTGSVFNKLLSFFVLLLHLGCFSFTARLDDHQPTKKRKKVSPLAPISSSRSRLKPHKALSSSWSYLKSIFSCQITSRTQSQPAAPTLTSARSSQQSIVSMIPPNQTHLSELPPRKKSTGSCEEKPQLLEQHQAIKHAVTQLLDGDSGRNIVDIIFKTGWSCKEKSPEIRRILKIHNSPKILSRFEEYREFVKAKAARNSPIKRRDERCVADGNELLRFYCSTFMCDLGLDGGSCICNQQYCSVCGIIKSGFSPKMDGISTLSTSLRAHMAFPEEIEEEFKFMNVKRAMLVCRVVAGRIGGDLEEDIAKHDRGSDSVLGRGGSGIHTRVDEEELLVFNPRAVLPCFVIVYTV